MIVPMIISRKIRTAPDVASGCDGVPGEPVSAAPFWPGARAFEFGLSATVSR
jgi:hypothetical protein